MKTSKKIPIICFLIAVGFAFFLSSKSWMTTTRDLIVPTKRGETISSDYTTFTMQRWDYDAKRNEMEIEVGLASTALGKREYTFEGTTRTQGKVDLKCIASNDELIVLRVQMIPEDWKEIRITAKDNEGSVGSLKTNYKKVHHAKLEDMDESDYLISYYQARIEDNDKKIGKNQSLIKENEKKIDDARAQIETVRGKMEYMTDQEKAEAENNVTNMEGVIKTAQEENAKIARDIEELKERNEKNSQRIMDIRNGEYDKEEDDES